MVEYTLFYDFFRFGPSMIPDYWIVFKSSPSFHQRFCKKGFGHCFILAKDEFNWVLINPGCDRFEVKILNCDTNYDLIASIRRTRNFPIAKIEIDPTQRRVFHWSPILNLPFLNCVSMVKYVLGTPLRGRTPYGLWKHLCNLSGKENLPNAILRVEIVD